MHHGYYIPENRTDHVQAQVDLIDEVLKWANAEDATSAVDVGCGIGGSSRHIARKFDCKTQGITLSPYQANRGNELAKEQGVDDKCTFQVADALDMPFATNSFDLVWSLVSLKLQLQWVSLSRDYLLTLSFFSSVGERRAHAGQKQVCE
jgi:tocopherol O-methyltransferase